MMAGREISLESAAAPSGYTLNPLEWWRSRSSWQYTTDKWKAAPETFHSEEEEKESSLVFHQPLARDGESMSIVRAPDWQDYILNVDLKFTTHTIAPPEGGAILYFRFKDKKNYYSFHFCLATRRVEFWKRHHGAWTMEGIGAVIPFELERWYTMQVMTRGVQHVCALDGRPVAAFEDDDIHCGSAGIGAKYCGASFRRIRMLEI